MLPHNYVATRKTIEEMSNIMATRVCIYFFNRTFPVDRNRWRALWDAVGINRSDARRVVTVVVDDIVERFEYRGPRWG